MLSHLPKETTQLLIDLCTTTTGTLPLPQPDLPKQTQTALPAGGPSYLSYLAIKNPIGASAAVTSAAATSTATASGLTDDSPPSSPSPITKQPDEPINGTDPQPDTPWEVARALLLLPTKRISPKVYFAHFVDHMDQFVVFLEAVAWRRWGQSVDSALIALGPPPPSPPPSDEAKEGLEQVAVWNTLLELYLTLARSAEESADVKVLSEKALKILRSEDIPYDPTHALILCSTRNHTEGLVLLWERLGMYEDIIRFFIAKDVEEGDASAAPKVVEHLKLYGPKDGQKHLYPLVLRHLTSSSALLSRMQDDVKEILEYVDREGIIPPLGIVQVLSRNGVASVGLVKEWLISKIQQSKHEIDTVCFSFCQLPLFADDFVRTRK